MHVPLLWLWLPADATCSSHKGAWPGRTLAYELFPGCARIGKRIGNERLSCRPSKSEPNETEIEVDAVDDSTCHPTQGDVSMNRLLNIKGPGNFEIAANRVKESQSMKKCVKGSLILVLVSVCLSLLVSVGMMKTTLNSMPTPGYFRDLKRNVTMLESKLADLHGSGINIW